MKNNQSIIYQYFLTIFSCKNSQENEQDKGDIPAPATIRYTVLNALPHDTSAFTQGFEFYNGTLYESTGNPEKKANTSWVGPVSLISGVGEKKIVLPSDFFGEGITILNDKIYQLTWQNQKGFVYDAKTFKKISEFIYNGEGWGITNDGKSLIVSNGSNQLQYWDPVTFKQIKTLSVQDHKGMRNNLNELEFINGTVYANVWTTDEILKIDTATGYVTGLMDLSSLRNTYPELNTPPADVLNGIAWDSTSKRMLITGKYWPKMFELKLN
ncbi:MAG: glutaminyl-peptide cyclotransferase, partial [Bacteroidota bacterium]